MVLNRDSGTNSVWAYNNRDQGGGESTFAAWARGTRERFAGRTTGAGTGGTGYGSSEEANRENMYRLLSGRVDDLKSDGMDEAIKAQLMQRISGASMPFDQATKDAHFTAASDQAAATAQAQAGRLRGNPADPSYQAQVREIEAGRAQAGQQARLGVDMQANLANYDARGQAMAQGGSWNRGRQGAITGQTNLLAQTLGAQQFTRQTADTSGGGGGGFGGFQNFQSNPAYQLSTYMPQRAPARPIGGTPTGTPNNPPPVYGGSQRPVATPGPVRPQAQPAGAYNPMTPGSSYNPFGPQRPGYVGPGGPGVPGWGAWAASTTRQSQGY